MTVDDRVGRRPERRRVHVGQAVDLGRVEPGGRAVRGGHLASVAATRG